MTTRKTLETKKGAKFEIEINKNRITLVSINGIAAGYGGLPLTPVNHPKAGWCFKFYHRGETGYLQSQEAKQVKEQMDAAKAAREALAATLEPVGFVYEMGCDAASTYMTLWNTEDFGLIEMRSAPDPAILIKKHLLFDDFSAVAEQTGAESTEATWSSYGGWKFDKAGLDELLALAQERYRALAKRQHEKQAESDQKRADAFAEAKEAGEPVVIRRWSEPCNDRNEECDLDSVTEYALPDGSTKTVRNHTW